MITISLALRSSVMDGQRRFSGLKMHTQSPSSDLLFSRYLYVKLKNFKRNVRYFVMCYTLAVSIFVITLYNEFLQKKIKYEQPVDQSTRITFFLNVYKVRKTAK